MPWAALGTVGAVLEFTAWRHHKGRTLTRTLQGVCRCDTRAGRAVTLIVCTGGGAWLGQHLTQGGNV
jgi:hypothetical protein